MGLKREIIMEKFCILLIEIPSYSIWAPARDIGSLGEGLVYVVAVVN